MEWIIVGFLILVVINMVTFSNIKHYRRKKEPFEDDSKELNIEIINKSRERCDELQNKKIGLIKSQKKFQDILYNNCDDISYENFVECITQIDLINVDISFLDKLIELELEKIE